MRIGISSDWHLGVRKGDRSDQDGVNLRIIDMEKAVAQVIDGFIANEVEAVVIPGDLYDVADPDDRSRQFLAGQLNRLVSARGPGLRALVVSLGNHDAKSIFDLPTAIGTAAFSLLQSVVIDRGQPQMVDLGEVTLTVVPWMRSDEELYQALENLDPPKDKLNLLFLHAGYSELPEFASLKVGSQTLTKSQLPSDRYTWIFCGHFHKHCVFPQSRLTIIGSPERSSSAEIGSEKGYLIYDTTTRTTTFHPIKTRTWYSLGTIDGSTWDAARIVSELEFIRASIPDWNEALVWGKVVHLSPTAYAGLNVGAFNKLRGSAFASEIELSVDDPSLLEHQDELTAQTEGEGEDASTSAEKPLLKDLPTEWLEEVNRRSTRKDTDKSIILTLGNAALRKQDLVKVLAQLRKDRAAAENKDSIESMLDVAPHLFTRLGFNPEPFLTVDGALRDDLVPAPPQDHELAKSRRKKPVKV